MTQLTFPNMPYPPRPTGEVDPSRIAQALLPDVEAWLESGGGELEGAHGDLAAAVDSSLNLDGFKLAYELYGAGWDCDARLVEILDNASFTEVNLRNADVREWVERHNVQVPLAIGDKVRAQWGCETIEGVVSKVEPQYARVVVRRDGDAEGCWAIVDFERCEVA